MSALQQIMLGTSLLTASAIIHVAAVAFGVPFLANLSERMESHRWPRLRSLILLVVAVYILVAAHTIQIWMWSVSFLMISGLPDLTTSFYFATVTYTTLGYGDIVLGPEARIVPTFCAVTGLLAFGISTAFLMGVLTRILPEVFADD